MNIQKLDAEQVPMFSTPANIYTPIDHGTSSLMFDTQIQGPNNPSQVFFQVTKQLYVF